jgi:hypothetical protein
VLTNRLGLPESIVKAVESDPYSPGHGDITVTRLIAPAFQRKLRSTHKSQEDVADRIWALVGQIGHSILERVPIDARSVREERLYMKRGDWLISGQFDLIEAGMLTDFKFTSVWAREGKIEWEQQANLLKLLCDHKFAETGDSRYVINGLQIVAIYRDWQRTKAGAGNYPKTQVGVIPVKLWNSNEAYSYLDARIAAHQHSDPEPCTDEERWKADDVVAVLRGGRAKAVRLFASKDEALRWVDDQKDPKLVVHIRAGGYRRCEAYCDVSHVCPVWKQVLDAAPF